MDSSITTRDTWLMSPRVRKLALTAHVTFSVGWMGAVVAFLILGIAGRITDKPDVIRGAYFAMNLIGEAVIVPMSLVALVTGLIQGLGTRFGLFKYKWVTTKLVLTVLATLLLMLHQFTAVAAAAKRASALAGVAPSDASFGGLRTQLVVDASLAIAVLLATTVLSTYKPWGLIAYEGRKQTAAGPRAAEGRNSSLRIAILAGVILAAMIAIHLATGGMGHHGH